MEGRSWNTTGLFQDETFVFQTCTWIRSGKWRDPVYVLFPIWGFKDDSNVVFPDFDEGVHRTQPYSTTRWR